MKKNVFYFLTAGLFLLTAAGRQVNAQDKSSPEKKTTHIRVVTVKDGKEEVIDTVYTGEDVRVFHLDGNKKFEWLSKDSTVTVETLTEDIEGLPGEGKKIKKVMVMKHQGGKEPLIITETETEGDSGKMVMVHVKKVSPESEDVIIHRPGMRSGRRMDVRPFSPGAPFPPGQHFAIMNRRNPNIINPADPGIISFKKKKLSGGREKITIIRNEVKETGEETLDLQIDNNDPELKKMNAPRVVREYEIQKKEPGKPIEIKTK